MDLARVLLMFHVIGAVAWVGGALMLLLLVARIRSTAPQAMPALSAEIAKIGRFYLMPLSLIVLISGGWLVSEAGFRWGAPWVSVGFTAIVVSAVLGMAVIAPTSTAIERAFAEGGPRNPRLPGLQARMTMATRLNVLVLVIAVAAMTLKIGE